MDIHSKEFYQSSSSLSSSSNSLKQEEINPEEIDFEMHVPHLYEALLQTTLA